MVLEHFPQGTNVNLVPFARHVQKAFSVDLPSPETAISVCQFLRGRKFPFVLPDGNTVELYVRQDRSIENRDARFFLGEMWKLVQTHLNQTSRWKPASRLGCGPNDLFYTEGLYAHCLVVVQKNRYSDFSVRIGDSDAMHALGLTSDQFQGLVDEALRRARERIATAF